ncbi:MAG TPA: homoserine dehydrogenase [Chitinophagales bacterium]|nr:homoserine dehydrogenase [Chitinophagales bacterium]
MSKKLKIGLFGFGVVGQGLYDVLHKTKGLNAEVVRICVKHKDKPRPIASSFFTFNKEDILNDESLDVVVELIDNADEAFEIVSTALRKGKAVVSANKKMIAEHLQELYELQQQFNAPFLYEASACGSIPIIRNLEEYYDNDLLDSLEGICNGTTNYILTKTSEEGLSYQAALQQAQQLGFAESNPTLDVKGFDAKFKLTILLNHTFGLFVKPEQIFNFGIQNLSVADSTYAREKGFKIKLIAHTYRTDGKVVAYVIPKFIKPHDLFFDVRNEFNAVQLGAAFSDKQFFLGKGAGSHPTGSAVLSDIAALSYQYRYEYKKVNQNSGTPFSNDHDLNLYVRYVNEAVLDELEVHDITQRFWSPETKYVIGKVKLSKLIAANLNDRVDVFISKIE